jgi:hypothetical protein
MAKARSPGYPVIGLPEAIEKIELVYKKDYQNKVPRVVVAQHMGYQGLNGKSLGVLSAVSKFGLLEGRGEENWVSDLALQIIAHERGSPEWVSAVAEAATTPDLFSDLKSRFPTGASDPAVRSYLLTRKFLPAAAEIAIRAYRETFQLVSSVEGSYHTQPVTNETLGEPLAQMQRGIENKGEKANAGALATAPLGLREYMRHALSPDCEVRLYVSGKMTGRELRKLRHLIYMSEVWEAETDAQKPPRADDVDKAVDEASKPSG